MSDIDEEIIEEEEYLDEEFDEETNKDNNNGGNRNSSPHMKNAPSSGGSQPPAWLVAEDVSSSENNLPQPSTAAASSTVSGNDAPSTIPGVPSPTKSTAANSDLNISTSPSPNASLKKQEAAGTKRKKKKVKKEKKPASEKPAWLMDDDDKDDAGGDDGDESEYETDEEGEEEVNLPGTTTPPVAAPPQKEIPPWERLDSTAKVEVVDVKKEREKEIPPWERLENPAPSPAEVGSRSANEEKVVPPWERINENSAGADDGVTNSKNSAREEEKEIPPWERSSHQQGVISNDDSDLNESPSKGGEIIPPSQETNQHQTSDRSSSFQEEGSCRNSSNSSSVSRSNVGGPSSDRPAKDDDTDGRGQPQERNEVKATENHQPEEDEDKSYASDEYEDDNYSSVAASSSSNYHPHDSVAASRRSSSSRAVSAVHSVRSQPAPVHHEERQDAEQDESTFGLTAVISGKELSPSPQRRERSPPRREAPTTSSNLQKAIVSSAVTKSLQEGEQNQQQVQVLSLMRDGDKKNHKPKTKAELIREAEARSAAENEKEEKRAALKKQRAKKEMIAQKKAFQEHLQDVKEHMLERLRLLNEKEAQRKEARLRGAAEEDDESDPRKRPLIPQLALGKISHGRRKGQSNKSHHCNKHKGGATEVSPQGLEAGNSNDTAVVATTTSSAVKFTTPERNVAWEMGDDGATKNKSKSFSSEFYSLPELVGQDETEILLHSSPARGGLVHESILSRGGKFAQSSPTVGGGAAKKKAFTNTNSGSGLGYSKTPQPGDAAFASQIKHRAKSSGYGAMQYIEPALSDILSETGQVRRCKVPEHFKRKLQKEGYIEAPKRAFH